jgi:hypothetical protein
MDRWGLVRRPPCTIGCLECQRFLIDWISTEFQKIPWVVQPISVDIPSAPWGGFRAIPLAVPRPGCGWLRAVAVEIERIGKPGFRMAMLRFLPSGFLVGSSASSSCRNGLRCRKTTLWEMDFMVSPTSMIRTSRRRIAMNSLRRAFGPPEHRRVAGTGRRVQLVAPGDFGRTSTTSPRAPQISATSTTRRSRGFRYGFSCKFPCSRTTPREVES